MLSNRSRFDIGTFFALVSTVVFAAPSLAAVVWDLNPEPRQHAPAGSSSLVYTSDGHSITAYGFDNNAGFGTPHELFYKNIPEINGAVEFGLGLTNTPSNEIQPGLHFIQFDFTAALAAGMALGQISVGSVQPGELFAFFGSNTLGTLGTQVGGPFGSDVDDQFVNIPNFGQFSFYSVVALQMDVLPVAVSGVFPSQVPEMNALIPIGGLVLLMGAASTWRRRRRTV